MKRGEIYFANLDPTVGSEIKKKRPVLIVSNNANNRYASAITVVPITSNIKKVYPFEVLLQMNDCGLSKDSKAQCQQVRTIAKIRLANKKLGFANETVMFQINQALKLHLDLS